MRKKSILHVHSSSTILPDALALFVSTRNRIAKRSSPPQGHFHAVPILYSESVATAFSLADASMGLAASSPMEASAPAVVFEPIVPSTTTLAGMGLIVILCGLVAYVWQTQVVPTSRTNLAISKSRGPLKEYLDELKQAGGGDVNEKDMNVGIAEERTTSATIGGEAARTKGDKSSKSTSSSRALERWLFTDWLNNNKSYKAGRQKEAALPILKDAKWNSGDNPVLAATALITLGVLLSAVTERVGTSLTSF